MADVNYGKRLNDRREGRVLRSLPPFSRLIPYIMRQRSDACDTFSDALEVSGIEQWLRDKRGEGWTGLGFLHLIVAAYVRTVSMRPGINRFVAGRRIHARNDIQVVLTVKRAQSADASRTTIKVSFSPTDTVFDVYRRLSDAVDEVKADVTISEPERIAGTLCRIPRGFLRLVMSFLRMLDYFDWLPRSMLDASPFHGSLGVMDLGSMGIPPVSPHIYNFGNLPCFLVFGAKRRVYEPDRSGVIQERRYVDYRITCDERIADAYYFASALKCLKYFMKNPQLLELPPETVEDDVN